MRAPTVKPVRRRTFAPWYDRIKCRPELFFEPATEEQLIEIVRLIRQKGRTCRVVGAGHSLSDLPCTDDYMIGTDRLDRLIAVDEKTRRVRVQGGMRLSVLHRHLEKHRLALSCVGSISDQSVGGLIATATHSTGVNYASMSTLVTELTMVTADGELLTCSRTKLPRLFRAALCSLGCLGIIVRVEFECERAFDLRATEELLPMDSVLEQWDSTIRSAEHVRLWWFPHSDRTLVWRASRTDKAMRRAPARSWFRTRLLGYHLYQGAIYASRALPALLPAIERWHVALLHEKPTTMVGPSHRVFNYDCSMRVWASEWAIPLEHACDALRQIRAMLRQCAFPVYFPIEVRFAAKDDIWLSPAQGRAVCYINISIPRPYRKELPYQQYWREFEAIMRQFNGRPHWAKTHSLVYEDLVKVYPHLDDFLELRAQLDPAGVFLNAHIRRHLLPSTRKHHADL
ncbi:D-arabinono-1,4-lactone oxidase-domain-containing protein [Syncephalis pseudoplumigaleata]|uniref:D-arabinono-1,4-lactone oxidase n=1 Tax=Syncephalis pseudoplumigaleata TaxID=1712513 RepID=A0A4P9Z5F8_9FUNG|nr:D-arabinono-1,4-lactone oxidase-domain-containing protein [Syncephalis pseudoplumigaleata]|eukprot:RKP27322.1 D-arabinono-1,4-lactone oxidase-domain-containing protein [Syncephalis pseudoplumigaleata]